MKIVKNITKNHLLNLLKKHGAIKVVSLNRYGDYKRFRVLERGKLIKWHSAVADSTGGEYNISCYEKKTIRPNIMQSIHRMFNYDKECKRRITEVKLETGRTLLKAKK